MLLFCSPGDVVTEVEIAPGCSPTALWISSWMERAPGCPPAASMSSSCGGDDPGLRCDVVFVMLEMAPGCTPAARTRRRH